MKRHITIMHALLVAVLSLNAQIVNPVKWATQVKMTDDTHGVVTMTATIDNGWHMYATEIPEGGPVATSVEFST
ncbi:MAG: sugar transporter, partial [Muribaculaceae bacterium]|nr:sugar transporter [Muribaculaceae bacterium]